MKAWLLRPLPLVNQNSRNGCQSRAAALSVLKAVRNSRVPSPSTRTTSCGRLALCQLATSTVPLALLEIATPP